MIDRNNILTGLVLGAIFPVVGYLIFSGIFAGLEELSLVDKMGTSGLSRRERTITLLAICANLVPFNFAKNRKLDQTMRGIIFPTLIYVAGWLWRYKDVLF